jgi:hypothetical protein
MEIKKDTDKDRNNNETYLVGCASHKTNTD